jgi:hypothetical protein
LATVYYMKEDLRQIWEQKDKATAAQVLDDWNRRAEASCVKVLQKFAATLSMHRTGILAYYDCRISTGPLEGTNNKIRTMQRQAYGFRDQEFFKLKILALHEAKYALARIFHEFLPVFTGAMAQLLVVVWVSTLQPLPGEDHRCDTV